MTALWSLAVLLGATVAVARAAAQSGCEVCASTGDCSRAYRGEQGQFCGNWLDRQSDRRPCCCPVDAMCKVSNYACNCGTGSSVVGNDGVGLAWLWWVLGSLGLLLCCCGCCIMAFKKSKQRDPDTDIPMATPVAGGSYSQPYGTAPSAPVYASASTPSYGRYYGRGGGMGAGTGAALGGTAGLVGGLLLGETLADHGGYGGDAGGFDGGGGGTDFAGDF
jgi:hypothetical protein